MPREMPTYRLHIEELRNHFPDRSVLSREDIMKYTGRGRKWIDSHGFRGRKDFTIVQVADILSRL